jgi:NAD(P)-dependent dehydrogenase (short-subunit alcohol dehydrogenase family)
MYIEDLFSLEGRNAVVTGASRGIGFGIARGFALAGANVLLTSSHEDRSIAAANEIARESGKKVVGIASNAGKIADVDAMVKRALQEFGRIDILMTNAGVINRPRQDTWDIDESTWDNVIDINLKGTFLCCQRVLKEMVPQRSGKIICMASVLSMIAQQGHAPYVASKGGILQLMKAMALEAAPYGINVNAVGPTYVNTDLVTTTLSDPKKMEEILNKIPMRRVGEIEDIVGACIYLGSKASDYVTGHLLILDGGHSCW